MTITTNINHGTGHRIGRPTLTRAGMTIGPGRVHALTRHRRRFMYGARCLGVSPRYAATSIGRNAFADAPSRRRGWTRPPEYVRTTGRRRTHGLDHIT
jgi:hypothetical protein